MERKTIIMGILCVTCALTSSVSLVKNLGTTGEQGEKGNDGKSAYEIWLSLGNIGTEEDFIKSLIGQQGEKGDTGAQGKMGDTGAQGEKGMSTYEIYCEQYGYTGTEQEWIEEVHSRLSKKEPEEIYQLAYNSTPAIICYDRYGEQFSIGSGFFISDDGLLVTAYHVIDEAYGIKVKTPDETLYNVQSVVGFDMDRDIAILRVASSHKFSYLELETSGITPGEAAYSFGCPLGFLDSSFSSGIVASNLRDMVFDEESEETYKAVQFTAPISQGNSGGPLLNAYGNVIGIVTSTYVYGDSLNIATYIDELKYIDCSYERSVSLFFKDTVYFQTKLCDRIYEETENNNYTSSAENIYNGDTYLGVTEYSDEDVYKFTVTEKEAFFSIAYLVLEDAGTIYYPYLCDKSLDEIEIEWSLDYVDGFRVYYAHFKLPAGTYYIEVEGYYTSNYTAYYLYTYWRLLSEFENFKYDIYNTDFMS